STGDQYVSCHSTPPATTTRSSHAVVMLWCTRPRSDCGSSVTLPVAGSMSSLFTFMTSSDERSNPPTTRIFPLESATTLAYARGCESSPIVCHCGVCGGTERGPHAVTTTTNASPRSFLTGPGE